MSTLSRTYLIALSVIALVIGISQFLVQHSISTGSSDSRTINISGRQRMLSQKITKSSLSMRLSTDSASFSQARSELQSAYELWSKSHLALQKGSMELEIEAVNNSPRILELFGAIQPHYVAMEAAIQELLKARSYVEIGSHDFQKALQVITTNEGKFLKLMNDITFEYDAESTARVRQLSYTEYALFGIALFLLLVEGLFIFRPAMNKIEHYNRELVSQGDTLKKSLAKEEFLNNQARSIFENVRQGMFLLDENLMISEFHSRETEAIFEMESLEHVNFLKLMRPRIVKRDYEALEMFAEQLFNPNIRESVLNRLNPVELLEIFPERGSAENLEPRYIRVSFSRIMREGNIHRILVTALDETENYLMRKQIEEAEERNQEESTQLIAILKVEPVALKEYIESSIGSLSRISLEYEKHKGDDFSSLANFTFQTVHSAKGNATLIGLELIERKLHKVEEGIVELKKRTATEGRDFLKILYQVTDVIGILRNMSEMQEKISSIYHQTTFIVEQDKGNFEQLKRSLESGFEKMCKEANVKAELNVESGLQEVPISLYGSVKDISVQLIRNSIAHGLESAEDRLVSGKRAEAKVSIQLTQFGDSLVMEYSDDGRGLDINRILSKALSQKLIEREDIKSLSARDISELIFRGDFSTRNSADMLAGRGQGMALIKTAINKHNGTYKLGFRRGQYFKIRISLPLKNAPKVLNEMTL